PWTLPGVDGNVALKVGKGEGRLAVSAIRSHQQREESRVLGNGHGRPIAKRPCLWREVEGEDPNLCNEWISHGLVLLYVWLGKIPNSEMMKLMARYGWMFVCGWLPPTAPIALAAMPASVL